LKELIYFLDIPGDDIIDVSSVCWLPNLHTVHIRSYRDWDPPEFGDRSHERTCGISVLHLSDCGAHEGALTELLSWPIELEELWYQVDQGEWAGHSDDHPYHDWECAAFVRALHCQKECLTSLTFTRTPIVHEGLGDGPKVDLHEFTKLTTLRIFGVFLMGDDARPLLETLPPNLEELEVYYDDTSYVEFLQDVHNQWLMDLADWKEAHFKSLRRVSVSTGENGLMYVDDDDERAGDEVAVPPRWKPPTHWKEKFEAIGVELRIALSVYPYEAGEMLVWPGGGEDYVAYPNGA
jgi:hypothetical protein